MVSRLQMTDCSPEQPPAPHTTQEGGSQFPSHYGEKTILQPSLPAHTASLEGGKNPVHYLKQLNNLASHLEQPGFY